MLALGGLGDLQGSQQQEGAGAVGTQGGQSRWERSSPLVLEGMLAARGSEVLAAGGRGATVFEHQTALGLGRDCFLLALPLPPQASLPVSAPRSPPPHHTPPSHVLWPALLSGRQQTPRSGSSWCRSSCAANMGWRSVLLAWWTGSEQYSSWLMLPWHCTGPELCKRDQHTC